jgi:hypothetical protein
MTGRTGFEQIFQIPVRVHGTSYNRSLLSIETVLPSALSPILMPASINLYHVLSYFTGRIDGIRLNITEGEVRF